MGQVNRILAAVLLMLAVALIVIVATYVQLDQQMNDGFAERDRQIEELQAELESVTAERDEARSERDAAIEERDAALLELDSAIEERDAARAERDIAIEQRDKALNDLAERDGQLADARAQLADALSQLESVTAERNEAWAQLERTHGVRLLEGDFQERSFPGASFYSANGTIELETGAWAIVTGDIGGHEPTRAGGATVTRTVIPSRCEEEPEGEWPGALVLGCDATLEWVIESRYPNFLLNILPLEETITVQTEEEDDQGE